MRYTEWCIEQVETHDYIGDMDSYAAQKAESELVNHDELPEIYEAAQAADYWQSDLFRPDNATEEQAREALLDVRRTVEARLDDLADAVIRQAVTNVDVHGHTVDLTQATRLEPCPSCGEETDAYYLGGRGTRVAWVCGHCGATVETEVDGGEVVTVEEVEDL